MLKVLMIIYIALGGKYATKKFMSSTPTSIIEQTGNSFFRSLEVILEYLTGNMLGQLIVPPYQKSHIFNYF